MSMLTTLIALLVSVLGSLGFYHPKLVHPAPCTAPIPYTIGSFDRRFGLSYEEFLVILAKAEAVWEKPLSRDLFSYAPTPGVLAVNLVYDYRQETTKKLNAIENDLSTGKEDYEALSSRYQSLKAQYDSLKATYDGTPQAATRLNALADEINDKASHLNALATNLNVEVRQYNAAAEARGDEFAGGIYIEDASGERIDIYEFQDRDKLVRTLAHELGHALGLEHVDDPKAIMYYLDPGAGAAATPADLAAAKALCGIQ